MSNIVRRMSSRTPEFLSELDRLLAFDRNFSLFSYVRNQYIVFANYRKQLRA